MLGSHAEADDAVQETWLRLRRNDPDEIENVGGLLTTVVGRVCLDRLRSRRARPEDPVDDLATGAAPATSTRPPTRSTRRSSPSPWAPRSWSCSIGSGRRNGSRSCCTTCSACRSTTSPRSSAAPPTASRQLASRARRRLQGSSPDGRLDLVRQRDVVDAFLRAARGGDFDALMQLLDPDVVLLPDSAAVAMGSLRETRGAEAVANALSGGARGASARDRRRRRRVRLGARRSDPRRRAVHLRDDRIVAIDVTGDDERIRELDIVTLD